MRSEPLLYLLESEANLGICHGVIVLRKCLVVDECILGEDGDTLADVEVQTSLILGSLHVALAVRLIHVVTRLHVDTAVLWQLSQWGDNQSIYTLLHYQIGVFNGQGTNTKDVDQQKNVIGGVWVMPVSGMRIGAFGWTGSYARKGTWNDDEQGNIIYEKDAAGNSVLDKDGKPVKETFSGTRSLNQNRYAFSFEYKKDGWTVRSEYIHSTGKAFAKSITNFNDANAKDCNLKQTSASAME